jgi:hypothetical protein
VEVSIPPGSSGFEKWKSILNQGKIKPPLESGKLIGKLYLYIICYIIPIPTPKGGGGVYIIVRKLSV